MGIAREHDLHKRRFGRNLGVGLALGAFVLLLVALTIVKVGRGDNMEGFDHTVRIGLTPEGE